MKLLLNGWIIGRNQDGSAIGAESSAQRETALKLLVELLLAESEWVTIPGTALSDEEREKWVQYRSMLQDLPEAVKRLVDGGEMPLYLEVHDAPTHHLNAAWLRFNPEIVENGWVGQNIEQNHTSPQG
jgi:hypothetical protein